MDHNGFLEIKELKKFFTLRAGVFSRAVGAVKAVDGVSLGIREGGLGSEL
jgi:ABC-type oligopeptide transport system ATPase subunit